MDYVHLTDDKLLGSHSWKGGLNLINIVLIGIADRLPAHDEKYELHRLLGTLLSAELPVDERLGIMEREYGILPDDKIRKDVSEMCNLSQGILEKGEARGVASVILKMHKKGYTLEQIADVTDKTVEEVEAIIEKRNQY